MEIIESSVELKFPQIVIRTSAVAIAELLALETDTDAQARNLQLYAAVDEDGEIRVHSDEPYIQEPRDHWMTSNSGTDESMGKIVRFTDKEVADGLWRHMVCKIPLNVNNAVVDKQLV